MYRPLFPEAPVASFHALFDERGVGPRDREDVWATLRDAEVVTAVDHMSGREIVIFGRPLLEELGASGGRRWVDVLRVGIDLGTDELPKLRAAVTAVKGAG